MTSPPRNDVPRTTLTALFIGALIVATFWVLRPFIAPAIWATMIVVTTGPMLRWFEARLPRRRALATIVMPPQLLPLFVMPLMLAFATIVGHADEVVAKAKAASTQALPPPLWLGDLPLVGERLKSMWEQAVASGAKGLIAHLATYADDIAKWFVSLAGSAGFVVMQFLLTALLAAVMYAGGETAVAGLRRFARRLAGEQGGKALTLAGQAIRGVALGARHCGRAGGARRPRAGDRRRSHRGAAAGHRADRLLAGADGGHRLALLARRDGWGSFALVWSLVVMTMDNVLYPVLIKRGADLPLLLIFAGVIGSLLAFGLVGLLSARWCWP